MSECVCQPYFDVERCLAAFRTAFDTQKLPPPATAARRLALENTRRSQWIMSTQPHQILVADDDSEIRKLLARYMKEQGFRVLLASSCAEIHEKIVTHQIDLIVLDVMLPDGSGLDLCRDLRAARSNIPIILLTALQEDVDRIIGLEIGADDYLGKPFNPRELVARIRAVLRRG